jgi:hypothetical protein
MELKSTSFAQGAAIPRRHTCDGEDMSPPLEWGAAPAGTASFALICDDPDAPAGTWDHWLIWNIPGSAAGLPEGLPADGQLADGARQGANGWRTVGYRGPCPPRGKPHRYFFRLYALDRLLDLPPGAGKPQLQQAVRGHVVDQAELMARYGRS